MNVLKKHGPQVLLAVVVLICGLFAWIEHSSTENKPTEIVNAENSVGKLNAAINSHRVSDKYAYGDTAIQGLKYDEQVKANLERTAHVEGELPAFIAYQHPSRPLVDEKTKPTTESEKTEKVKAALASLTDVTTETDHGMVLLAFKLPDPKSLKYLQPVRVEIYRGEGGPEKIDTKTPFGTVELNPEEDTGAPVADAPKVADVAAPEQPAAESAGARRRKEREAKEAKEASKDSKKDPKAKDKTAPKEEIPAKFANFKSFKDTFVEEKRKYSYQLRLITKMTVPPDRFGVRVIKEEKEGILIKKIIVEPPPGADPIKPTQPGSNALLFATQISTPVSATTPANFEVRLAGTNGKIDPPTVSEFRRSKDYQGRFAVRVWVTDAQEWKEIQILAGPDERLKGAIAYKKADQDGKMRTKDIEFDTKYRLVEIKWGENVTEKTVEEQEVDKDGNQVWLDANKRQPKLVKRVIKGDPIPNEIAVLEDTVTKKMEEFPKRANFEARKQSLVYFERLAEEQEKANKIHKDQMDKLKDKLRTAEEQRKQAADAAADPNAAQPASPFTPVVPNQGGRR